MALTRGDRIAVRVLGGTEVVLRFWGRSGRMILVTNDEEYERLTAGLEAPWPVAFHPEDVRMIESERTA
jgi:hypothetical protein